MYQYIEVRYLNAHAVKLKQCTAVERIGVGLILKSSIYVVKIKIVVTDQG